MRTAIIATVKNEEKHLSLFLLSLRWQIRRPDVVVITDGGSTDKTPEILNNFAKQNLGFEFKWAVIPGNRSKGRNEAIRMANADLIASTNVCSLNNDWFEQIISPLERGEADVVGGAYEIETYNERERAAALLTNYSLEDIDPETYLPPALSIAFTYKAWETVGGYPDLLDTSEDTVFDMKLKDAGFRFVFSPKASVLWRPHTLTLQGTYRTYKQFADTDMRARVKSIQYISTYSAYIVPIALFLLGFGLTAGFLSLIYFGWRIRKILEERIFAQIPYAILIVFVMDIARMLGCVEGVLKR